MKDCLLEQHDVQHVQQPRVPNSAWAPFFPKELGSEDLMLDHMCPNLARTAKHGFTCAKPPSTRPGSHLDPLLRCLQRGSLSRFHPRSTGLCHVGTLILLEELSYLTCLSNTTLRKKQMGITTFKSPNRSKKTLLLCIELQIPNVPCAWHLLLLGHPSSHLAWELLQPSLRPGVLMLMPTMISLLMSSLLWEPHRE